MISLLNNSSKLAFLLLAFALVYVNVKGEKWKADDQNGPQIIDWDVTSYYGYLPATFIHGDLTLEFIEADKKGFEERHQFWPEVAPNGGKVIKTTMGMSMAYSPFFFLAHGYTSWFSSHPADGYSPPYKFMLILSCIVYLLLGFWFLRKLLLRYFSELVTACSMLVIYLGTNLFYYSLYEPCMSHAYSFSLCIIFTYSVLRWFDTQRWKYTLIIGLVGGLIVLIRPVNLLFFMIPVLIGVTGWNDLKNRISVMLTNYKHVALIAILGFLVILPQLLYWKYVTGDWFFNSYGESERFYFGNPHILEGLFSYRKGWLLYTPVMTFALIGIVMMWKKKKELALLLTVFITVYIVILFSWWSWWYGGGFGSRPMVDIYGLLALPLATFFSWVLKQGWWKPVLFVPIIGLMVFLNQFQTHQKVHFALHWDGNTKESYWYTFGSRSFIPGLDELIKSPDYDAAKKGLDEYEFSFGLPDFEKLEEHYKKYNPEKAD